MSLAEFLGLLANVATFGAAFVALFALLEVKKQRASAYQPDLAVIRAPFFWSGKISDPSTFSDWLPNPPDGFDWNFEPPKEEVDLTPVMYKKSTKHLFALPVVNLGLGAAKFIKVKWSWPIKQIISDINHLCIRQKAPMSLKLSGTMLEIEDHGLMVNINHREQDIDFCLPISMKPRQPTTLMVPFWYLQIFPLHFFLHFEEDQHIPNVPGLLLDLEYFDIGGVRQKRHFKVEVSISFVSRNPETRRMSCRGILESQPIHV